MKISSETLGILQEFSSINPSVVIEAGSVIKTRPPLGLSPMAKASIPEEFPNPFAIADLKAFLNIVKLYDEPDFEFLDNKVIVSDETRKTTFRYAERSNILYPDYSKDVVLPSKEVELSMPYAKLNDVLKAAATLRMPDIAFHGDGENLYLKTFNSTLPQNREETDSFSVKIGQTDEKFTMIFTVKDVSQMIKQDYKVSLCFQGIAAFESTSEESKNKVWYWISPSDKSKYSR